MSFRYMASLASQATEAFPRLFSKVFAGMFGQLSCPRTTLETSRPNASPNSTETATARFAEGTLATPPPSMVMKQSVR